TGAALFRLLCHCSICRAFNAADYADIVVYAARDVQLPAAGVVAFTTWRPPPNVQRGKCARCQQPALELFRAPALPHLAMVPVAMHGATAPLPRACAHLFYESRVRDVDDTLPRHRGYVASQLAFMRYLLASRWRRRA
ncbi:MAG: GFA family protein, partial [Gammaproteobacteria bacterium]